MIPRWALGNLGGFNRLRASRPGHDVTDLSLDPRFVSFDTDWRNALRWYAGGSAAGSSLTTSSQSGSLVGSSWIYWHKQIPVPGISPTTHTAIVLVRENASPNNWQIPAVKIENNLLRVCPYPVNVGVGGSPGLGAYTYYWWVFSVNPTGADPTESGLSNSFAFGNHPTRGAGLFISRRGKDVLDCLDSDLVLSTQSNCFQFHETGTVTKGAVFTADIQQIDVTLSKAYPDFPPILAWRSNAPNGNSVVNARWVNSTTIRLSLALVVTTGACVYRWGIIATDPSYEGGVGTIRKPRYVFTPDFGFGVTKKNIGYDEAGENDWIFRSDRLPMQFRDYGLINFGAFGAGLYSYPASAVASQGSPFTLFQVPIAGTWIGCGFVSSIALNNPANGARRQYFSLFGYDESRYRFTRDEPISYPSGVFGYAGVANVADF